jgi:hypothetical protein
MPVVPGINPQRVCSRKLLNYDEAVNWRGKEGTELTLILSSIRFNAMTL